MLLTFTNLGLLPLLGTHDVQLEQAVYSSEQVDVSCSYLEASQDRGYLVIVFSNLFPTAYCVAHRTGLESTTSVSIPGEGLENPMVVVYDLNYPSGLPERIQAVKPRPAHAIATTSFGSIIHNGECINILAKLQLEACQPKQKLTNIRVPVLPKTRILS